MWNGINLEVLQDKFIKQWTGVVLLAETSEETAEPYYIANKIKQLYKWGVKVLLLIFTIFIAVFLFIKTENDCSIGFFLLLLTNIVGVYICALLLQKQMKYISSSADKICSLFKQGDCNNVIESDAAKLFGLFSWSEIGIGYFISNIIILLYFPNLAIYSSLINIIVLPYSVWSVWYQKVKAKQWCVLCLIVQVLLWILFIINVLSGTIIIPVFSLLSLALLAVIYATPYLIISLITPLYANKIKTAILINDYNSIKMKDEVFLTLLKKEQRYYVDINTSCVLFGDPQAKILVTILTNPHCNPCAKMHERVEKLIDKVGDKICIQYIFSSFNEELEESSKCLIRIYNNYIIPNTRFIYNEWFKTGKDNKQYFYNKYHKDVYHDGSIAEFDKHVKWKENTKLSATPTILVNGYALPKEYKIEDLEYFSDLAIDTK